MFFVSMRCGYPTALEYDLFMLDVSNLTCNHRNYMLTILRGLKPSLSENPCINDTHRWNHFLLQRFRRYKITTGNHGDIRVIPESYIHS